MQKVTQALEYCWKQLVMPALWNWCSKVKRKNADCPHILVIGASGRAGDVK